jgi:hypothetical protein
MALPRPSTGRHPTARPQAIITTRTGMPNSRVDSDRPMMIAERAMGRVRKRSTTPSLMSVATATATLAALNSTDMANRPGMR